MRDHTTDPKQREQRALPTITPERFWHERAVEYQQRLIIIRLLSDIRLLEQQQCDLLRRLLERTAA